MYIFVNTLSGKIITHDVESTQTVDGLKYYIQFEAGSPSEPTELEFSGLQLEDGHKLAEYKIVEGSTLDIVRRRVGGGMKIFLLYFDGKPINLQVEKSDTIDDVITKLQVRVGYFHPGFMVKFGKFRCTDTKKTLAHYGVEEGDRIGVTYRTSTLLPPPMPLKEFQKGVVS